MEIIEAFNEGGKSKAEKLVQEKYGKHYHIVQRNIAKNTGYSYSRHTQKYELNLFLSLLLIRIFLDDNFVVYITLNANSYH